MEFIDPNWTIHNDKQSVTVGINTRLWQIYKQKMQPTLIRLGREHTALFLREHFLQVVPNKKPRRMLSSHLVWDDVSIRLCYKSRTLIPISFNDYSIIGIAVEAEPKTQRSKPTASKTPLSAPAGSGQTP